MLKYGWKFIKMKVFFVVASDKQFIGVRLNHNSGPRFVSKLHFYFDQEDWKSCLRLKIELKLLIFGLKFYNWHTVIHYFNVRVAVVTIAAQVLPLIKWEAKKSDCVDKVRPGNKPYTLA